MAQMLRADSSTERILDITRRHERLCLHTPNGEQLATVIHGKIEDLESKHQNLLKAKQMRENALDDVSLAELALENSIRTLFERCKQLDRENPSGSILYKIFPESKFGPYIEKKHEELLDEGTKLVQRLENPGIDQLLAENTSQMREKIEKLQHALQKYHDALQAEKQAQTTEQLARAALREQYEMNYFDARKLFRKNYADRLFPEITQFKRKKTIENTPQPPASTPLDVTP